MVGMGVGEDDMAEIRRRPAELRDCGEDHFGLVGKARVDEGQAVRPVDEVGINRPDRDDVEPRDVH